MTDRAPVKLYDRPSITEDDLRNMKSDDFKDYTLYIARDDPNSMEATAALSGSSYAAETAVTDVFSAEQLPSFVDGVPIVHCKQSGDVHRGVAAIHFLGGGASADPPIAAVDVTRAI